MRILILDNYDSFTYNLYHYILPFCDDVTVARNDEIGIEDTDPFTHIVLSPGPGLPHDAGILMDVIKRHENTKAILGICLGMQAIALHFGAKLYNQPKVKHGVTTKINHLNDAALYKNLPQEIQVGLYHSWAVDEKSLPSELQITARSSENVLMSLQHKNKDISGVQFHPESILTEYGKEMIANWINAER